MKIQTFLIIFSTIIFSSCAELQRLTQPFVPKKVEMACASVLVDDAFQLYNEAKANLAIFYERRDANLLYEAYYLSYDSVITAKSVRNCEDKAMSHFLAWKNLYDMNKNLRKVIRANLPDDDRGNLIAIYKEQYNKLMTTDIQ
ncbi:MAG: hypothetical protein HQM12_08720 [SAR324 cluster bacterium]|nr:hypothetical protein [SAR324 cluster bacterium]